MLPLFDVRQISARRPLLPELGRAPFLGQRCQLRAARWQRPGQREAAGQGPRAEQAWAA